MAKTQVPGDLIQQGAITAAKLGGSTITPDKLHTSVAQEGLHANSSGLRVLANNGLSANSSGTFVVGGTGVTSNSTGVHIGQDVAVGANVEFGVIKFANMFATENDLPSATTYHGMFAHVHGTGKGYYAHAGAWVKLIDESTSDTDDLSEGLTNLYFTNARSIAALSNGTGVSVYSNGNISIGQSVATTGNVTFNTVTANVVGNVSGVITGNVTGNVTGQVSDISNHDTDDLSEGATNLYFTSARAVAALSNGTGVSVYSNGNIAIGQSVGTTDSVTFANVVTTDITVSGNLIVQGTTTTIDSATLSVNDAIITVASGQSAAPSLDAGIEVERGSSANVSLLWNETNDKWTFTNDGSTYANIATSTTDLAEGTNLYYTTARANTDIDARVSNTFVEALTINVNTQIDARVTKTFVDALSINANTLDSLDSSQFLRSDADDTLSGTLTVIDAAVPFKFEESGHTGTGKYWRMPLDSGNIRFDVDTTSTNGDGTFTTYTTPLKLWANGAVTGPSKLTVTDLVVSGNLTVVGTSNQSTTTSAAVSNADIVLLSDHSGAPSSDARLVINRGTSANVSLKWNETSDVWQFTNDGTNFYPLPASTTNLSEGTNLYYTTARFDSAFSGKSTTDLSEGTNLYYTTARFDSAFSGKSTTDLSEGTNLYFTNARVDARVTKPIIDALNINADTVDSIHAASFLRSDAADTATGQLFFDAGFDSHPIMLSGAQNFDNIDRSGFYNLYNTNTGSTSSPGFDYGTMIAIGNDKGAGGFGLQIAHERTGSGMYVRGMNDSGATWSSWEEIWTSGTDGAGSGLDADTLDTLQASSFLRSDATDEFGSTSSNQKMRFNCNSGQYIASAGLEARFPIEVFSPIANGGDAAISFHISSDYAGYFGLAADVNDLCWGGWSVGSSTKHRIFHQGNVGSLTIAASTLQSTETILATQGVDLNRDGRADTGLSWYSPSYTAWQTYMAPINASGCGPNGNVTAPGSAHGVSSWALRSYIENVGGYGWTWESGTAQQTTGTVVMGLNASSGNLSVSGTVTANSDERIKKNIKTIDNALDKVLKLRGVTFQRTDVEDDSVKMGVVAQEVERVIPEVVQLGDPDDKESIRSVAYGNMVGLLIEAIKDQQKQIEELKAKLEDK